MAKYILPKLRDIIYLSIFYAVIFLGPKTFNVDGDLGRHITIGNYILNNYSIPIKDVFSFTMQGQPLTPHEWLAQVIFALSYKSLSLAGPVLVTALLIGITFSLVYFDSQKRSKMPLISIFFTIWAAAASNLHWLARPHIFTFLFLAIWIYLLDQTEQGKKVPYWIFGAIMLIWANTHGGFVTGFLALGAYTTGDLLESWVQNHKLSAKIRVWIITGMLSFAVTFINPVGPKLWGTSLGYIGNSYLVNHTQEYLSPNFHFYSTMPFLALIGFSVLALGFINKRLSFSHALLLSGWTILALYSSRNIPLYAIAAAPILSKMTSQWVERTQWVIIENKINLIEQQLIGRLIPVLGTIAVIFALTTLPMQSYNSYDPAEFPVEAVDWLEENPQPGLGFNYFSWGGYLLFRQWPEYQVFIDGQTDFYGENITREYEQVVSLASGWEQVLEKYAITWVLNPTHSPLISALSQEKGWKINYQDNTATLITKDPGPGEP